MAMLQALDEWKRRGVAQPGPGLGPGMNPNAPPQTGGIKPSSGVPMAGPALGPGMPTGAPPPMPGPMHFRADDYGGMFPDDYGGVSPMGELPPIDPGGLFPPPGPATATTGQGIDEQNPLGLPVVDPTKTGYDTSQWDTDSYAAPGYTATGFNPTAMGGWEQSNWANPNMQTPKYVVGRILSQFSPKGGLTPEALRQIQQAYPGATFDGKDRLDIPGVGSIDVLVNAVPGQGGDSWAWQDLSQAGGGAVPGGGALPFGGGGLPPTMPTIPGAGGGGPTYSGGGGGGQSWQDVLAGIFNQNPGDILNNPALKAQQGMVDYQSQRTRERLMNQIAERNAAQGMGDSVALAGEQDAASIQIGEQTAGLQAQLAVRALEQEQAQIMQALGMAQQYGTAQEQMALQERLAQIQASLQQQSINNQYSLGLGNLALGQGNLGLGYYNANNQNQQFNDNLGWQMAQWQQQQNWLPWLFGMGQ